MTDLKSSRHGVTVKYLVKADINISTLFALKSCLYFVYLLCIKDTRNIDIFYRVCNSATNTAVQGNACVSFFSKCLKME